MVDLFADCLAGFGLAFEGEDPAFEGFVAEEVEFDVFVGEGGVGGFDDEVDVELVPLAFVELGDVCRGDGVSVGEGEGLGGVVEAELFAEDAGDDEEHVETAGGAEDHDEPLAGDVVPVECAGGLGGAVGGGPGLFEVAETGAAGELLAEVGVALFGVGVLAREVGEGGLEAAGEFELDEPAVERAFGFVERSEFFEACVEAGEFGGGVFDGGAFVDAAAFFFVLAEVLILEVFSGADAAVWVDDESVVEAPHAEEEDTEGHDGGFDEPLFGDGGFGAGVDGGGSFGGFGFGLGSGGGRGGVGSVVGHADESLKREERRWGRSWCRVRGRREGRISA